MTAPTIVFDLDGTLADTAPDLYATVCYLLAKEGRPRISYARLKEFVGDGAGPMIRGSFGDTGDVPEGDEYDRLLAEFLEYYRVHLADSSAPFPEVLGAIHRWKARGARIAICTNKKIDFAEKQLATWRIRHLFDAVKGADSYPFRKPDGRHLTETIKAAGGDPSHAVMIGDSASDTGAARDAGVPVIAVTFGYGRTPARELDADRVIEGFIQLDRAASELMGL